MCFLTTGPGKKLDKTYIRYPTRPTMPSINALIAPPGAGKTTWLLRHLEHSSHRHSLLAFPTKILSSEVERRLKSMKMDFNSINSSTVDGSVTQCLEENLANKNDKIIVCTHESLRLIKPDVLEGWNLYIDEIPTTWDCDTYIFSNLSYLNTFERLVEIVKHEDQKRIVAKESCKQLIAELADRTESSLSENACKVLTSLLDDKYVVEIDSLDAKEKRTIRIIGTKDYIPAFQAAEATTIMGAEIEKTLLGVILKGSNWSIRDIKANLDFSGYGNQVIIHPFLVSKAYSKSAALMKHGKINQDYQDDCLLDAWLKLDVFRIIGNRKAILVAHAWCQPNLPIKEGSEFSNIRVISIDNRGVNDYDNYSIAICLQHGNITPIEKRSIPSLAKMLSIHNAIDGKEITDAIKYERFYESTLQSVCRTALRSREHNGTILLFVQDMDIAEFLAAKIGNCTIDSTYSEVGVAPTTPAKARRDSLKQKAIELWQNGNDINSISAIIGKTDRTVREWLKPYRELEKLGES